MRDTLKLIVLLGALLAAAGCGAPATAVRPPTPTTPPATLAPTGTPPSAPDAGPALRLRAGETLTLPSRHTLTLVAVGEDSRCPRDVACDWQGDVEVTVRVGGGPPPADVTLRLFGMDVPSPEDTLLVGELAVRLVALDPYPTLPLQQPAAYVATFSAEPRPPAPAAPFVLVKTQVSTGFVVPAPAAPGFGEAADGYWTPGAEAVRQFEQGLEEYLKQAPPARSPALWQKQAGYQRQYGGLIRDGRALLHASFFCDALGHDPQRTLVLVEDGGDCFFQITYDPATRQYDAPRLNGEAYAWPPKQMSS